MICDLSDFWTRRRGLVATQYRESVNLLAAIEIYCKTLIPIMQALCSIDFDIDTATGHQLTVIGKAIGFPRTQCSGIKRKNFGFCEGSCNGRTYNVAGFCDGDWNCGDPFEPTGGEYTFTDDELYRRFLKAVVIQNDNDYRRSALVESAKVLFGDDAGVLSSHGGNVSVFTGRAMTQEEYDISHLFAAVLPVAPGVSATLYENETPPFGFGTGWGGFCDGEFPTLIHSEA